MNIIDPFSGKKKFFKGKGRKGKKFLDDYQKMLISEPPVEEPFQKKLSRKEKREKDLVHQTKCF